jgi:hypothetical protein
MTEKRRLTSLSPIPLIAIIAAGLASYAFHAQSSGGGKGWENTLNCNRAREHLREADQRFADALDGLRKIDAAKEQLLIGDRTLASKYIERINSIRDRLHQISEEADDTFAGMVLPEVNSIDED